MLIESALQLHLQRRHIAVQPEGKLLELGRTRCGRAFRLIFQCGIRFQYHASADRPVSGEYELNPADVRALDGQMSRRRGRSALLLPAFGDQVIFAVGDAENENVG